MTPPTKWTDSGSFGIKIRSPFLSISSNASETESFLIEVISSDNTLLGDVNGDSILNVLDVIQLVSMALGNQE